jgi:hypothetical protein
MDLNKDNRNIYTVDAETYSEYMHDNWEKPTDFLSSSIKILLVVLLLVVGYFFYKIVKADLSFAEVFNKKELIATYSFFKSDEEPKYIEKEDYIEVLAKNISTDLEEPKKVVLSVTKKYDEPIVVKKEIEKKEEVKIEKVVEVVVAEVILEEPPSLVEDEVKTTEVIVSKVNKLVEKVIIEKEEIVTNKVMALEKRTSRVLTETYLDRMVEELNSL